MSGIGHQEAPRSPDMGGAPRWPLLGRARLLETIARSIDGDVDAGVVLTGRAGVGKSRAARAAVAEASARGIPTEWVAATDAMSTIPLGAFAHVLQAAGGGELIQSMRQTADALVQRAGGRRVVLGVDDAHLLDPVSATLVHQLATSRSAYVVVTARTGEEVPDAIVSLWKDQLAPRIDVSALSKDEVDALLAAALDGDVEGGTARRLWAVTEGNPLFLHELVLSGLESGSLTKVAGLWRWRGPLGDDRLLVHVLEDRLAPLAPEERDALELLAVGEPLGVHPFETLVGIEVVDRLERQNLLRVQRDDRREEARLAHPLYGEVLRAAISEERESAARRRLAEIVAAVGGRRRDDVLRIAMWATEAGAASDPDLLVVAATAAEARFDAPLAERFARHAVESGGGTAAMTALASALRTQGRCEDAEAVWSAVPLPDDEADVVAIAQNRSSNLFFGLGRGDDAMAAIVTAMAKVQTPARRDELTAQASLFPLYGGRLDEALAIAEPLLSRAEASRITIVDASLTAATAHALAGSASRALAIAEEALPVTLSGIGGSSRTGGGDLPDWAAQARPAAALPSFAATVSAGALMATRYVAYVGAGRLEEAFQTASILYDLAVQAGTHDGMGALACALGQAHLMRGDVSPAIARLREGAGRLRERDRNRYLAWCLGELALASIAAGDLEAAERAVDEAEHVRLPDLRLFESRLEVARAHLVAAGGDTDGAVEHALTVAGEAEANGSLVLAAIALLEATRLGGAARTRQPLAELATRVEGVGVATFAAHSAAVVDDDPLGLERASAAYEQIGARLLASEVAAAAAHAHRRRGDTPRALAAGVRSRSLAGTCEGAAARWVSKLEPGERLSAREQEVATLAAGGLSSRAIADRLYVSVRTVDNHLYRAYAKLGVTGREDLAIALGAAVGATAE